MTKIISLLIFLIGFTFAQSLNNSETENLYTFSRLYGYVRYFHPSDEAQKIDWDKFLLYGVERIRQVKNDKGLVKELKNLFYPVAPSLNIYNKSIDKHKFTYKIRRDTTGKDVKLWRHYGIELPHFSIKENVYKSRIVKHRKINKDSLSYYPSKNEKLEYILQDSLRCLLPVTVYYDSLGSIAVSNYSFDKLQKELNKIDAENYTKKETVYLANIIKVWNIYQHFFPYFDEISVDWNGLLKQNLKEIVDNKNLTEEEYWNKFLFMVEKLKDGHTVLFDDERKKFNIPVRYGWIENKVVVTASKDEEIKTGDIITHINGKVAEEVVNEKGKIIAGSDGLKRERAMNILTLSGREDSLVLKLERGVEKLEIKKQRYKYYTNITYNPLKEYKYPSLYEIKDSVYYINNFIVNQDTLKKYMNKLAEAKSIIFDLRNNVEYDIYKKHNILLEIFPHLFNSEVNSPVLKVMFNVYPEQHKKYYSNEGWSIKPALPKFKGESIFITDNSAISQQETLIDIVKFYKLGKVIGAKTAGCNGDINIISLIGGYGLMYTGMKVLKHDGSQLYLKGYEPDIKVERTIKSIKEGRDEVLDRALEYIEKGK